MLGPWLNQQRSMMPSPRVEEELSYNRGDWMSKLFMWDPRWENYWEAEVPGYQLQERKQWFAILARIGNYMVIVYLSFSAQPSRRHGYSTTRMFQAKILVGEDIETFLWILKVEWN